MPEEVDGQPVATTGGEDDEGGIGWVVVVGLFALLAALLGNDGR